MAEKVLWGNLSYDVPLKNRAAYSKLRALFKRKAVMQTASSYLFPWGMAKIIEDGIKKINTDSDGFPLQADRLVRYRLFKFDEEVSGEELRNSAESALSMTMANAKEQVNKLVNSLKNEDLDAPVDTIKSAKVACRRAINKLRDARALALLFNMTGDMNAGFLAYEAYIMAKRGEVDTIAKSLAI
tara:strand:- start:98938 stop:99492 length:555 start_codon:yes stop_codon:yes gene_type:complete